ncbi:MAG: class I SAM-dependent methyltransferase [Sphingomonadaceae bacterium]|uniref:class I SAM-dependent methyltransferase n=1 Tax=Thermaurantiacus sp. TaxID=2820283 RepID=UPI00298F3C2B|nr:class I SAM-dependent methyltransferase [Thermaurantiacus sp.]MCS6986896.1 class I SAM-dependent methyltransferase [Sphingomonadaceae bacterium]MDW8415504.1 class I SAM-dependent methyltransferase [Thermaurantiacus sp.]
MTEGGRGEGAAGPARASFGFRDVAPHEKTRMVGDVFRRVAQRYDLMNDLMSVGLHRRWKDRFVALVRPRPGEAILDLAGGTGDVALRLARRGAEVTVVDINPAMLAVGRERARRRGLKLAFVQADAEALPFADAAFSAVTVAFGIRNMTHIDRALAEARRVLAWGGRFACLEFSATEWAGFARLYDLYSFHIVPRLGQWVAGDRAAYRYLVESIRRFPDMDRFAGLLRQAGFAPVRAIPILGGAVAIHLGWKT